MLIIRNANTVSPLKSRVSIVGPFFDGSFKGARANLFILSPLLLSGMRVRVGLKRQARVGSFEVTVTLVRATVMSTHDANSEGIIEV